MALFSIHFCGNKSFSTHKNSFLSFRSHSFCATCSFYFFSQFLSHFSPSENFPYNSISQRNSQKGGHFKLLTPALRCPLPQLPGASSMTTRICGVKSWTAIFSTTTVWAPRKIGAPKERARFRDESLRLLRGADEKRLVPFFCAQIKRPWIPIGPRSVIGFIKLEDSTYCNNWHIVYRAVCDTVAFVCSMYNSSVSCVNTYVT